MKDPKKEDALDVLRQLLGGTPPERKLHYTFAYEGLPGQFFAATDLMWPALKQVDSNGKILKGIWRIVGEMANLTFLEPEGLKADFRETDAFEIVTVVMPTPKYIPEAYYCIILKNKVDEAYQYYTIENSGTKAVLGRVFAGGSRKSIEDVLDTNLDACIQQILSLQ